MVAAQLRSVLAAVDAGEISAEDWQLWWLRGAIRRAPGTRTCLVGRSASFMWNISDDLHTACRQGRPSLAD
jgi:hypothetical protein